MTMKAIEVTPALLNGAAGDCNKTATDIEGELSRLKAFVAGLYGPWSGVSATAWEELMRQVDREGQKLKTALDDIAGGLRNNAHNYEGGEVQNTKIVNAVADSVPRANL